MSNAAASANVVLVGSFSDTERWSDTDDVTLFGEPVEANETTLSDVDNCARCGQEIFEHDFGARIWCDDAEGKTIHNCR